jgi:hypothetical protein
MLTAAYVGVAILAFFIVHILFIRHHDGRADNADKGFMFFFSIVLGAVWPVSLLLLGLYGLSLRAYKVSYKLSERIAKQ